MPCHTDAQAAGRHIEPDPIAAAEPARSASEAMERGWAARDAEDYEAAREAFRRAGELGADPQRVQMELGFIELAAGNRGAARSHFEAAAGGPDEELAGRARDQLPYLPNHLWADAYFEAWAWHRMTDPQSTNLVPTLRMRAFWRPLLDVDLNLYVYGRITRDVASRGRSPTSIPLVYADNHALLGGGVMLRLFGGRLALWAQAGPAFNLLDDGRDRISFDARVGAAGGVESDECRVAAADDVQTMLGPCFEGYGEAVYVSRFDHDVIAMLRGRAGYGVLRTGPVLWQPIAELRALGSINGDYYNNLAELGAGHRWRLLEPFVIDLITTVSGGVYYGVENVDPLPDPPVYLEARALLTTYAEIR